jgi:hypothetical protein
MSCAPHVALQKTELSMCSSVVPNPGWYADGRNAFATAAQKHRNKIFGRQTVVGREIGNDLVSANDVDALQ